MLISQLIRIGEVSDSDIAYLTGITKDEHYRRNEYYDDFDFPDVYDAAFFGKETIALDDDWDDTVSANCHQFTSPDRTNFKLVSPDGKYEVIYDKHGNEVTDVRDIGTYNYVSPLDDKLGHTMKDVIPWIFWGNAENDTTTRWSRVKSMLNM